MRNLARVAAVLLGVGLVVSGLISWFGDAQAREFRGQVDAAAEAGTALDLGGLMTEAGYDRLVVVCPYTPLAQVRRQVGVDVRSSSNASDEATTDLVLARGDQVAETVTLPRAEYDFCSGLQDGDTVPAFVPADAVFSVSVDPAGTGSDLVVVSPSN